MSPTHPGSRPFRLRAVLAAGVLALLLTGCNLAVGVELDVRADGSGDLELAFQLDEQAAAVLEADGVDLTFGLDRLRDTGTDWSVDVERGDGVTVRVSAPFEDQAELTQRVTELNQEIDLVEDGGFLLGLDVDVDADGLVRVNGAADVVLPATTGAVGDGVVFDGDDLRAFLDEQGTDALLVEVRFQLPGPVLESNADVVEGRRATWTLTPGETRELSAEAMPTPSRAGMLIAAVALVGFVAGVAVTALRRR